jgi:uncharacterized protein (DUF1330 family)
MSDNIPKGYWIVHADVSDMEQFQAYIAANRAAFRKFGARFLARAGRFEVPEGTTRSRNTIVEFPTYQAALDCWHSPEYQTAMKLRLPASTLDIVIVEGCAEPQT